MPLAAGTRLGPYEVVSALGAGGMGEVYRARDTRLGRDVALKVLPSARQEDDASRARFDREAQALAALNHPHIAAIHDVIDVGGQRAIVMEFVPGRALSDVIARGPLPIREALGHAIDVADALVVAHAAGIVHRDLKPANVVITDAGGAKVLDFGIAKLGAAGDVAAGDQRTNTALTGDRALVGTIGYLSPEQAHGHPVDARSDLFNLGVVLHEMITGHHAFQGDSAAALLSAVIRDDPPPLRTLVPDAPRGLERLVARCLQKDPRRRFQTASDLKAALEDVREDLAAPEPARPPAAADAGFARSTSMTRRGLRAVAYGVASVGAVALGFFLADATRAPSVVTPRYRPFIAEATPASYPTWSPDGRTLAYLAMVDGRARVFTRGIDAVQSTEVTREPATAASPFWSPDGSRIYFARASDGSLVSVGAAGGAPQVVVAAPKSGSAAAPFAAHACMRPDGRTIVLARGVVGDVRLWTVDVGTREPRPLEVDGLPRPIVIVQSLAFSPDGTTLALLASATAANQSRGVWLIPWPKGPARHLFADASYLAAESPSVSWMPDNRRVVISEYPERGGTSRLLIGDTTTGALVALTVGQNDEMTPSVSRDGHRIAFVSLEREADLIQVPMDGGPPQPLVATSRREWSPDLSPAGILAYVTDASGRPEVRLRSLTESWSRPMGGDERDRATPPEVVRLSPDSQRAAVGTYAADHLIWIVPTAGGTPVRLDTETTDQHGPSWSPDGNWVAYRRLLKGSWQIAKAPLGGGPVVRLADADPGGGATDWSPDGRWIAHSRGDDMHLVSPDGTTTRVLDGLRSVPFRFSRDGARLFAIRRGTSRRLEVSIWDVASGREVRVVTLPLSATDTVQGLTLALDETRLIVGAGTGTSDIWLLEDFDPPSPPWAKWLRW